MPVRKVSNRGGNIIGKFPSIKMGRMIAFESLIECDFIYLLDYAKEVEWFEEQPLTIEYSHGGKVLHYTPDFQVVEAGRNVLIECKPEKFVTNEENQRKALAAREWCDRHGWEYRVITGKRIRRGSRLQNIKLLTRYARQTVCSKIQKSVYLAIKAYQEDPSIEEIAKTLALENPAPIFPSILHMIFHHKLYARLNDELISWQTQVRRLASGEKEDRS